VHDEEPDGKELGHTHHEDHAAHGDHHVQVELVELVRHGAYLTHEEKKTHAQVDIKRHVSKLESKQENWEEAAC